VYPDPKHWFKNVKSGNFSHTTFSRKQILQKLKSFCFFSRKLKKSFRFNTTSDQKELLPPDQENWMHQMSGWPDIRPDNWALILYFSLKLCYNFLPTKIDSFTV
jgi:hypothetical protein